MVGTMMPGRTSPIDQPADRAHLHRRAPSTVERLPFQGSSADPQRVDTELEQLVERLDHYENEIAELQSSRSWQTIQCFGKLRELFAPRGSRRRRAADKTARLADLLLTKGPAATARKLVQSAGQFGFERRWFGFGGATFRPTERPVFLLVTHQGGGGTERHVSELARALQSQGIRPVLVRPGGRRNILWEERDGLWQVAWRQATAPGRKAIESVLARISPVHALVYHMMGIPDELIEVMASAGLRYDWTILDYHAICPRAHLNRKDGSYCGEPDTAGCRACLDQLGDYHGRPVAEPITTWRVRFARHLGGARRVFAPSEDVRNRLARYFPGLPVLLRPLFEDSPQAGILAARWRPGETVRVAVVGNILPIKGSQRLLACARNARIRALPLEFHVVGSTDRDAVFARQGNVRITGPYREGEVFERLAAARCHLAFLPSIWPETYMYTLSITMAAGLYSVCFDLGAQAERVKAWGWGQAIPLEADSRAINHTLLAAAQSLTSSSAAPPPPPAPSELYADLLSDYCDFTSEEIGRFRLPSRPGPGAVRLTPHSVRRSDRAHLH
jgi:glycosyltransferase involved in cell wall biosynthesis